MNAKGAIKPVQQMSEEAGDPINPQDFIGAVAGYYSSKDGKLVSMPFNSSTVVFYYNKDAFQKAGLDPENRPRPGEDLAADTKKLKAAGMECGYTTSWPSWVQLETFSAWHTRHYATKDNGFGGLDARPAIDQPLACAAHEVPGHLGQGQGVHVRRARRRSQRPVHFGQVRDDYRLQRPARQHHEERLKFGIPARPRLPYYADVEGRPLQEPPLSAAASACGSSLNKKPDVYKGVT